MRLTLASLAIAAVVAWVPVAQAQPVPFKISFMQNTYATEWTENGENWRKEVWVRGFKLFRYATGETPWPLLRTWEQVIETEQPTDTLIEVTDTTIKPGLTYCYMARAYNQHGDSGDSNTGCASVPTVPTGPNQVQAIVLELK